MRETRLTEAKTGEKLGNFQSFAKGDFIIADRAYGTMAGLEYPRERGSDYPLRYRTGAFNLYTAEQERVEVTDFFAELKPEVRGELPEKFLLFFPFTSFRDVMPDAEFLVGTKVERPDCPSSLCAP
jgi:hypothetical protein